MLAGETWRAANAFLEFGKWKIRHRGVCSLAELKGGWAWDRNLAVDELSGVIDSKLRRIG